MKIVCDGIWNFNFGIYMNMTAVSSNQPKRIHPHKFLMWVAIASICMMFAGLTSAYMVKRSQSNFTDIQLPVVFWYSTFVIIVSSITIHLAMVSFKAREISRYKTFITITAILGVLFAVLQWIGFQTLGNHGVKLLWQGSNPAASFLVVIIGLHVVHVLGGIIALFIIFIRAYRSNVKTYTAVPIEIMSTYWHFVDILWIYLFIFLMWLK
jgi:cytochrome c oxidase subunit 3